MKKRLALMLTLLLALGASPARAQTEITLLHGWGTMENAHVAMRQIYEGFMQAYPDVKLTLVSLPDTEQALAKAGDMLSVGEAPDLLFTAGVNSAVTDFMIGKGYALNLAPYLEADEAFRQSVSPLTLRTWTTEDGALYTLADVLWLNGLWQNDTLLAQAGVKGALRTWDDFFAACDQIVAWSERTGRDVRPVALTLEDTGNLLELISEGLEPEGTLADAARLADALAVLKRLYGYAGKESLGYQYRDTLSLFNQGRTVFYVNGIWASGLIDPNVNASCAAYPGEQGTVSGQSALCGYVLGNTGDKERMAASVAFVKYMLAQTTQTRLLTLTGQFPSSPLLDFSTIEEVTPRFLGAVEAIRGAELCTDTLGLYYSETQTAQLVATLRDYLTDRCDVEEAVRRIRAIDHR